MSALRANTFIWRNFCRCRKGRCTSCQHHDFSRWIDSARNDLYAKVFEFVNPQQIATGPYLDDIVAMWLPSEGLHVGDIIRLIHSPSLQSHYPVFEW